MTDSNSKARGGLRVWSQWLQDIGIAPVTGWRWRRRGWITTVNLAGRQYVSAEAIAEFERRADAGEFAKVPAITNRTKAKE